MKLREQKRLLVYLEMLVEKMSQEVNIGIHPKITKYLAFEDLIDIVLWTHPNTYRKELLSLKSKEELINLIEIDVNILLYTIAKIEKSIKFKIQSPDISFSAHKGLLRLTALVFSI